MSGASVAMQSIFAMAFGVAPPSPPTVSFNVRAYGAIGDGVTDDTASIQRCINDATNATISIVRYHDKRLDDPTVVLSRAEVYVPRGHYLLTRTLTMPTFNHKASEYYMPPDLRGEARAILHMNDSTADLIFGSQVVRWRVSSLQFLGGKNQLHIGNNNTDKGQIIITDCSFDYASGAAIRFLEPSRDLQPARVGKPAHRRGPPTHSLRSFHGSFSTHVTIRDCAFIECVQVDRLTHSDLLPHLKRRLRGAHSNLSSNGLVPIPDPASALLTSSSAVFASPGVDQLG